MAEKIFCGTALVLFVSGIIIFNLIDKYGSWKGLGVFGMMVVISVAAVVIIVNIKPTKNKKEVNP